MPILRETIQEFKGPGWTVRVWREYRPTVVRISPEHDDDVCEVLNNRAGLHFSELADRILELERVTAVEVKDGADNGCVHYRSEEVEIGGKQYRLI